MPARTLQTYWQKIGKQVNKMPDNPGKKWIKGAIKKPGALHKQLGISAGKNIPAKVLNKAAKAGGVLGRRARLAKTLKSFK